MDNQREIVQFQIEDLRLDVHLFFKEETAWLSLNDISLLFEKDKSVISRHIKKSLKEHGDQAQTVAKIATVKREGNKVVRRLIDYYNLDVVMPIATRIESRKALLLKTLSTSIFATLERRITQALSLFSRTGTSPFLSGYRPRKTRSGWTRTGWSPSSGRRARTSNTISPTSTGKGSSRKGQHAKKFCKFKMKQNK